jgi:hypothetical protein
MSSEKDLCNNYPTIRNLCRTISSLQKKSVEPFPVSRKKCQTMSSEQKKVDPFLVELSNYFMLVNLV